MVRGLRAARAKPGRQSSGSSASCPFVMRLSFDPGAPPMVLADALIHECAHLKLRLAMGLARFCDGGGPTAYRHPWRQEDRPLEALMVATHAFVAIHHFYLRLVRQIPSVGASANETRLRDEVAQAVAALSAAENRLPPTGRALVLRLQRHLYRRIARQSPMKTVNPEAHIISRSDERKPIAPQAHFVPSPYPGKGRGRGYTHRSTTHFAPTTINTSRKNCPEFPLLHYLRSRKAPTRSGPICLYLQPHPTHGRSLDRCLHRIDLSRHARLPPWPHRSRSRGLARHSNRPRPIAQRYRRRGSLQCARRPAP